VTDTAIGFGILGIGILLVLAIVFAVTVRGSGGGASRPRPRPPRGVHLPPPSMLPVTLSIGAALIGAGLAFRPDGLPVQPIPAALGLLVLVYGIVGWVGAAGREWRDTEHEAHDEPPGH
jgi:hypothetical protein